MVSGRGEILEPAVTVIPESVVYSLTLAVCMVHKLCVQPLIN
jgi:hypothetical protein